MKRSAGIFLLACLLIPTAGAFLWIRIEQSMVRREVKHRMMAGIDRTELVLLLLSKAEAANLLEWEHDGEFEYQNQMYDVVERGCMTDSVWYLCWPDQEETALNHQLEALRAGVWMAHSQSGKLPHRLLAFFSTLFPPPAKTPAPTIVCSLNPEPCPLTLLSGRLASTPPSPPPRL